MRVAQERLSKAVDLPELMIVDRVESPTEPHTSYGRVIDNLYIAARLAFLLAFLCAAGFELAELNAYLAAINVGTVSGR